MKPEDSIVIKVRNTYPEAKKAEIVESLKSNAEKLGIDLKQFKLRYEKSRDWKRLLKVVKRDIYHKLRQYDRASVDEMEEAFEQLAQEYGKSGLSEKCLELHKKLAKTHRSIDLRGDLEAFYSKIWKITGKPSSILDIGAGINAFTLPFTGLERAKYLAIEKKKKYNILVNKYLKMAKEFSGEAVEFKFEKKNRWAWPELQDFDVALFLKSIPAMERYDYGVGRMLWEWAPAKFLVVSGSVKSMIKTKKILHKEKGQMMKMIKKANYKIAGQFILKDEFVIVLQKSKKAKEEDLNITTDE